MIEKFLGLNCNALFTICLLLGRMYVTWQAQLFLFVSEYGSSLLSFMCLWSFIIIWRVFPINVGHLVAWVRVEVTGSIISVTFKLLTAFQTKAFFHRLKLSLCLDPQRVCFWMMRYKCTGFPLDGVWRQRSLQYFVLK